MFGGWGDDVLTGLMPAQIDGRMVDTDTADYLNGGGGDDSILAGSGDIVTAGSGADQIVLGEWLVEGDDAQILDYTPGDDSLVLIWDDGDSDVPDVQIADDPEVEGRTIIMMNGAVVASVNGTDLQPGDIALVPLSSAVTLGFA